MTNTTIQAAGAIALAIAFAGPASADTVVGPIKRLDDTGMAKCLVAGAFTRDCAGTGQDGESGRDAHAHSSADGRAGFRYVRVCSSGQDEGTGTCPENPVVGTGPDDWACTRDLVTDLLWEIKQADGSIRDQFDLISMQNWGWGFDTVTELRAALDGAAVCGSTSWDAATLTEMLSLLDFGITGTTKIDRHFFPNTPTTHEYAVPYPREAPNEGIFNGVDFIRGMSGGAYPGDGTYVRLVTRPQLTAAARFAVSADGANVTDRWTRLMWQRCPVGATYADGACTGHAAAMTWTQALRVANHEPGWRLPNVKELVSLTTLDNGSLDPVAFLGARSATLWSSTPFGGDATKAWEVAYDTYGDVEWYPVDAGWVGYAYLVRDR